MKHQVMFDLPTRELGKADVHFEVKQNRDAFGKLEVSRGSIVWYPRGKTYGHKLAWTDVDWIAKQYPRVERRKKK